MNFNNRHKILKKILLGLSLSIASTQIFANFWQTNHVGATWSNQYNEPANPDDVSKTILNYTHLSGDNFGRNLLVANLYLSDDKDPKANGKDGATEYYVFYRRYLSYNAFFPDSALNNEIVRDMNLTLRVDKGLKNSALEPNPTKARVGLSADLKVPKGYLEIGADWYYESANNNFTGGRFAFDPTYAVWTSFGVPVGEKGFVDGFVDFIGASGPGYFNEEAKPSTMVQINYLYDVGAKSGLKVGVGYEYWRNKYLIDSQKDEFNHATHSVPYVTARYSF